MSNPVGRSDHHRYLITGGAGMLGGAVYAELSKRGFQVQSVDLPQADLTKSKEVEDLFDHHQPTRVVHCAAYTNVDKAESEPELCELINVAAPANVARACRRVGAMMQLISTDFVFDGSKKSPYTPDDATAPQSVYARTKRDGEQEVIRLLDNHQIIRTAWLFGPGKGNFVTAIYGRLQKSAPLRVVSDQVGTPTFTVDLARVMADLSEREEWGFFHAVNGGQCSWYEFARAIASEGGYDPEVISPIAAAEWGSPAERPHWSVLDCSRIHDLGIEPMRPWREALAEYMACLKNQ